MLLLLIEAAGGAEGSMLTPYSQEVVMHRAEKWFAMSLLGIALVALTPIVSIGIFGSTSAFADSRDVGHKAGDKGKQDSGTVSWGH